MDEEERGGRDAFVPSRGMKDKGMYGNMKVGMVVSLFAAAMLLALSLPLKMPAMLAPAVALLVLGAMFSLLGHTPKESLYLYFRTKETKLKKTTFVCICVILAVIIAILGIVL